MRVHRHSSKDVKPHILLSHVNLDILHFLVVFDQACFFDVVPRFLIYLSYGTVEVIFIFVYFASRKAPICTFLPSLHQHDLVHCLVEHNSTTHRNTRFVSKELRECGGVVLNIPLRKQRTMLEYPEAKGSQGQGWEGRVKGSYKVFVEPLCFFHLEADPFD
jgi:hypothetical protein